MGVEGAAPGGEEPEVEGAPPAEETEEQQEARRVVNLLDPAEPAFKAVEELLAKDPDALKMTQEEFEALPQTARAQIARLRGVMTRATGEKGEASRRIAAIEAERAAERAAWEAERAALLSMYGDPKHLGDPPADEEPDPRTHPQEWIKWNADKAVFERTKAFGTNLQAAAQERQAAIEQAKAEAAEAAEATRIERWFDQLEGDDAKLADAIADDFDARLKATPRGGRPPDLDELLIIHRHKAQQLAEAEGEERAMRAAGVTLRPSGGPRRPAHNPPPPIPHDLKGAELADYFRRYPEARERFMAMSEKERVAAFRRPVAGAAGTR